MKLNILCGKSRLLALILLTQAGACGSGETPAPTSEPRGGNSGGHGGSATPPNGSGGSAGKAGPRGDSGGVGEGDGEPSSGGSGGVPQGTAGEDSGDAGESGGSGGTSASGGSAGAEDGAENDAFGVKQLYPTLPGGRVWQLPANAQTANSEWSPSSGSRGRMTATEVPGVFKVGEGAGPRLPVKAPKGKAWFRNVEATGYYRYLKEVPGGTYAGYQIIVRGEWHRTGTRSGSDVNDGLPPPEGAVTGPGYPFAANATVNAHCLAASYHGGVTVDGRVNLVKEVSHTAGYTGQRGNKKPFPNSGPVPVGKWFGYKLVVQNQSADKAVHLEAWLDLEANNRWTKIFETDDTGGWNASDTAIDDCAKPPFNYAKDEVLTWSGPYVLFRFDYMETEAKWFSVREIAPLP